MRDKSPQQKQVSFQEDAMMNKKSNRSSSLKSSKRNLKLENSTIGDG